MHRRHHGNAHHHRYIGAVNVSVQDANLGTHLSQGHGQIHRDGGLAHATLAAGHSDDVLDRHIQLTGDPVIRSHLGAEFDGNLPDPWHFTHGIPGRLRYLIAQRAGWRRELDGERDIVISDLDVFDHVQRHQILV